MTHKLNSRIKKLDIANVKTKHNTLILTDEKYIKNINDEALPSMWNFIWKRLFSLANRNLSAEKNILSELAVKIRIKLKFFQSFKDLMIYKNVSSTNEYFQPVNIKCLIECTCHILPH